MRKILSVLFILLTITSFSIGQTTTEEIKLLSPKDGVWCNKQMLIIEDTDSSYDYYFSLNGSDPEISGFAYDGPILLDLTGTINLRIKRSDGLEKDVKYSVISDNGSETSYKDFISIFYEKGQFDYISGNDFVIPENLVFTFTDRFTNFQKGSVLTISDKNVVERSIPCIVMDTEKNRKWRFILNINCKKNNKLIDKNLPFEIVDWNTIKFTDKSLIYRIDENYWHGFDHPEKIDRSVEHKILWQSINYSEGNPVESFVLPPLPSLKEKKSSKGDKLFVLDGNPYYEFGIKNKDDYYLFRQAGVDVFTGDSIKGEVELGVFYNSVLQGFVKKNYDINKSVPDIPEIIPSDDEFFVKNSLTMNIESEKDTNLFVSISKPYEIQDETLEIAHAVLQDLVEMDSFFDTNSNTFKTILFPVSDNPCLYKVQAYCTNNNNASLLAEYSFVIGQNIYFVDENSKSTIKNGSQAYPFTNLKECVDYISCYDFAKIKINGPVHITENIEIKTNCELIGLNQCDFIFENNASLLVNQANVKIEDISFETVNSYNFDNSNPFLICNNSEIKINDCIISANFGKSGYFADIINSSVVCNNLIGAVYSENYSSFATIINSSLELNNSKINSVSNTATLFTVKDSELILKNNEFMVYGSIGRICELFNTKATIDFNSFNGSLSNFSKSKAIYRDELSEINETGNEYYGF